MLNEQDEKKKLLKSQKHTLLTYKKIWNNFQSL